MQIASSLVLPLSLLVPLCTLVLNTFSWKLEDFLPSGGIRFWTSFSVEGNKPSVIGLRKGLYNGVCSTCVLSCQTLGTLETSLKVGLLVEELLSQTRDLVYAF